MIDILFGLWNVSSLFCPFKFSSVFATNTLGFIVNWMLLQIEHEIAEAQKDLIIIPRETSIFLPPPHPPPPPPPNPQPSDRQLREATAGLAALAAVGLFGSRITIGNSDSC